jgi:putative hydrolase of the HAD superfamily
MDDAYKSAVPRCHNGKGVLFNFTRTVTGGRLALRSVVFDYGIVLTGPPNAEAWAAMKRITGLPEERFAPIFWGDRLAYDEGKLTGVTFWKKLLQQAGLPPDHVEELNRWDCRLWGGESLAMVAWQRALQQRGLLTAILSNMGDSVLEHILRQHAWIRNFDVLVWSYQLGIAKPDPAIYRHTLGQLGTRPEETLFIDDRKENVQAARVLGIQAIEFSTVEQLRADLRANGFGAELPLPLGS